ncbi:MAG: phosphoribosylglycinamide formyltransferase [Maricaulis sp.]|jgi:phosphoribosylglycinamide formyltransferase-1|uniref:phosphoribosylglycinamide formyltransferase n=1 Tax=Maricaulis sp. TaxID=1486257 RepID=UPI001B05B8AE|nr:phosphoribosylglycinamide formyltransferase [Maricaulis sp.]MBO6728940.1 phosphoribosylglycinamide formyltransferase [Maricaulis sp.]MBO6847856.1 phosphoribosylglycinamide formyltransferase [Maricaulis sp.]MBO6877479.1 phosphoribosylglycinamide formyltransferase [Maricaulis sp.]
MAKTKIAVLISGRGSNMQAIVEAAEAEDYPAEIALVVSNNPDAAGLAWAADRGIETEVLNHRDYETREGFEEALDILIRLYGARIVCLAGFMRILTPYFTEKWRDLLVNVHPSLLPSFKGLHTHERALEAGVRIHGCTVHYVRPEMDDGPIIGQAAVPVLHGDTPDTLAARVLEAEHQLYPQCIALACSGKARVAGERVRLQVREFGADLLMNPHD